VDPRKIPWDVIEKHSTRGPRYTSYPTAPHFREDFDRGAVEQAWRAATGDALSVYVHVPYCHRRCLYCGCHTEVLDRDPTGVTRRYVHTLLDEVRVAERTLGPRTGGLAQLALGGGTPTTLQTGDMARLLDALFARWRPAKGAELSVEIDPRTVQSDLLDLLLAKGFNRVSLGVQDLDDRVQQIVGRVQPESMVRDLMTQLRSVSQPPSINIDLIQGLPGQTPESWRRTIDKVVALDPDRMAVFGYAHVPWMRPHQRTLEGHARPDPRERVEMLGIAWEAFVEAGYVAIGFDHFARPEDELAVALSRGNLHRNFMGYTTRRGLDQLGLGVSAISAVGPTYAQDHKNHEPWLASIGAGQMPWERALVLDDDDLQRREVILDLSCNLAVDFDRFLARHGVPFQQRFAAELRRLAPLVEDGLVDVHPTGIEVTPRGRFLVRVICMVFDRYLDTQDGSPVRYSRTV
jgi:oxygen-independent coproporphyrinogen III oxidase